MKALLKWLGIILAGVVVLLLLFVGYIYWKSGSMMSKTYAHIQGKNIYVPTDSATVARGKHLVLSIGTCSACHGQDLGGKFQDAMPFAAFGVPNLTGGRGGLPADYSIADLDLAVRHGIKRDKTGVRIMPSFHLNRISDEDLAAIYAYMKVAPKVDNEVPPFALGPIGRMILTQGGLMIQAEHTDHSFKSPARPEIAPTAEYGKYIAEIACTGCHGPVYSGGPVFEGDPSWPPAANLTTLNDYTHESFQALLKTGIRPDGTLVDTLAMPIEFTKLGDSTEVAALWNYLSALPKREMGKETWPKVLGLAE